MPEQVVPGQVVDFKLTIDDAIKSRGAVAAVATTVDGMATVRVNDVKTCRAEIRAGRGSCAGVIKNGGRLVVTATLDGTDEGQNVVAEAAKKVPSSAIAIGRAHGSMTKCVALLRVRGTSSTTGRAVIVEVRPAGGRWQSFGVAVVLTDSTWSRTGRVQIPSCRDPQRVRIRARLDDVTTRPVKFTLATRKQIDISAKLAHLPW